MEQQVYNFYAGPAAIPDEVLRQAQDELLNFDGTGMSVLEISHRAAAFDRVVDEAIAAIKSLLDLGDDYEVLFLQGGASLQFSMVPMNFLKEGSVGDYIVTGSFASKAQKEAKKLGQTFTCFDGSAENFSRIPRQNELQFSEKPAYVHMTTNNTIYGTEFHSLPDCGDAPLVADMSSDIMSRPLDARRFALIYAGAQKNLGPSGVTVVIVRKDFLATAQDVPATMLQYETYAKNKSLYNTPPCFSIYLLDLVCRRLLDLGGLEAMGKYNAAKAALVYDAIDRSGGFYRGHAAEDSRSLMNVTFRLPDEELEKRFAADATAEGLIGLKGHRSVGGLRASIYNAMEMSGAQALAQFMAEFARKNG